MTKDTLYQSGTVIEDFSFNDSVAEVFDDMLNRSVPFYLAVIEAMAGLLGSKELQGRTMYDLGCSTGTTLIELARRLPERQWKFVGVDNAPAMVEKATRKTQNLASGIDIRFLCDDITSADLPDAGAILCNYTLQFIRPIARLSFVSRLYDALPSGGMFIISEKVISHDSRLNREFIKMHHHFKRSRGYSEMEISAKREALENILVPFSIEENIDLLHQAGFEAVDTFFQWFNFASFVALKKS